MISKHNRRFINSVQNGSFQIFKLQNNSNSLPYSLRLDDEEKSLFNTSLLSPFAANSEPAYNRHLKYHADSNFVVSFILFLLQNFYFYSFYHSYPIALQLVASGKVDVKPLVTHRFFLEQSRDAFATSCSGQDGAIKVIIQCFKNKN